MQEVFYAGAFDPRSRFHFAGRRDYMVRSEKRGSASPEHRTPNPESRPPRRRRKRAGFFYKFFMLLLLLTVWPIGLVMLWQRKLRWGAGTKLLTSIVTLAACVVVIGFALTVNTNNARYTAIQDGANNFLDSAADSLIDAGTVIGARAEQVYDGASDLAQAAWSRGSLYLADGIDWGVQRAMKLRALAPGVFGSVESAANDASPEPTAEPTPLPTSVPAAELYVGTDDETLPVYLPSAAPEGGSAVVEGMLSRAGELDEGPLPTPVPTPEPTPEPLVFDLKPAADATVYYTNGGRFYHMASSCGSMTNAPAHLFSEVRDTAHQSCSGCKPPDKSLLDEKYVAWVDDDNLVHLSDECESFAGTWRLMTADAAIEAGYSGCATCGADRYLAALSAGESFTLTSDATPTPEPTAEPTPAPTEAPTAEPTAKPSASPSAKATAKPAASSKASATPKASATTKASATVSAN